MRLQTWHFCRLDCGCLFISYKIWRGVTAAHRLVGVQQSWCTMVIHVVNKGQTSENEYNTLAVNSMRASTPYSCKKWDKWEKVLAEDLHAVRWLVCLAANETPHERLFRFPRITMNSMGLPSWLLTPETVLLRRHVRPFMRSSGACGRELGTYSVVRLPDGRESTVSASDLAPYPHSYDESENPPNTDYTLP